MQQKLRPSMFLLAAAATLLGAASKPPVSLPVQIADTGPLAAKPAEAHAVPAAATAVSQAMYEAAPVPDRNVDTPDRPEAAPTTQLAPALLSEKAAFAGDAFSANSSQEQAINNRQQPAAGLSLSVPVK